MKKAVWSLLFVSSFAFAEASKLGLEYNFAPYDVVVPALNGDPSGADRQIGQVYIDVTVGGSAGIVKAVAKDGSLLNLSSVPGSSVVGNEDMRIVRATISNSGGTAGAPVILYPSSNPGVDVDYNSTGDTDVNFDTPFGGVPTCTCTTIAGGERLCSVTTTSGGPTASTVRIKTTLSNGTSTDMDYGVICIGPQ